MSANVIHLDTVRARPRHDARRFVHRCDRCRVPLAPGAALCVSCVAAIDDLQDAHRSAKLREAAARICCACLWPTQPRERVAVELGTFDVFHALCVVERVDEAESEVSHG